MDKISIIIPAYNEAERIGNTLSSYHNFFNTLKQKKIIDFELLVVLNGCVDNTFEVVQKIQQDLGDEIRILDLKQAGKGIAIIAGFADALTRNNNYIGFVDADMATEPEYFYELYEKMNGYDGIIASRYMPESKIDAPRPWVKEWGRKLIYNNLVNILFGIKYIDYQCGAKLFKRPVIEVVINDMQEGQWAFDVELLYLAKKHGFNIGEIPTVWYDKAGSKLDIMGGGMRMLKALFKLKRVHSEKK
jgi:glycosyltransferase involved in cell wall biosynthesis